MWERITDIEPLSFLFEGKKDLIVAEIGCFQGQSTEYIVKNYSIKEYYAIDPYVLYKGYYEGTVKNHFEAVGNSDICYQNTKKLLSKYDNVTLMRLFSEDAVKLFEDGYFDVIWLDGNHAFEYVSKDIINWYPKVKKNGILAGDDSFNIEVMMAVRNYFPQKDFDVFKGKRSWLVKK